MQDGILVGAIAVVGYPNLGDTRDATPRKKRAGQKTEASSHEGGYGLHKRAKNSIMPGLTGELTEERRFHREDAETQRKTKDGAGGGSTGIKWL